MTSSPQGTHSARKRYLATGVRRVNGWLRPEAARLIAALADAQTVSGAVGEIGVHHGKLFLLLELCRKEGENAVAVDLFGMQDLNVDGSGHGNLKRFEKNLAAHAARPADVVIRAADSTTLDRDALIDLSGGQLFRLFSVDGGHTAEITFNDLRLAADVLAPGGLLILDDYFNVEWPGVSEGASRYLMSPGALVPVGSGHGKTFFCDAASAPMYRERMKAAAQHHHWRCAEQSFHGTSHVVMRTLTPVERVLGTGQSLAHRLPGGQERVEGFRRFLADR